MPTGSSKPRPVRRLPFGWIPGVYPPSDEREVLMLMKSRSHWDRRPSDRITIGYYSHKQAYWRPRGSNGNFNSYVTGWMDLPGVAPQ